MNRLSETRKLGPETNLTTMCPAPQSGGVGSRYAGFGGPEGCSGDGSDQRLLPLLPQGQPNRRKRMGSHLNPSPSSHASCFVLDQGCRN